MKASYFILSGLPLLAYPMVFVASLMSLAAYVPEGTSSLELMVSQTFFVLSLGYPLAYVGALIAFFLVKKESAKKICIMIPYGYFFVTVCFFLLWAIV